MLIDNITHTSSESRITNFLVWHGMGSFLKPKIQRNPWKVFISSKLLFIHHKQCSIQWCSSDKLLIMNNILAFDIMISSCLINADSFEHCNASIEGGFWDLLWVIKKIWRMAVEGRGGGGNAHYKMCYVDGYLFCLYFNGFNLFLSFFRCFMLHWTQMSPRLTCLQMSPNVSRTLMPILILLSECLVLPCPSSSNIWEVSFVIEVQE